ncbi:uncharacterized protein LOC127807838 isoform X2 [Diospyros lotus]|uniref:uncharacterized protein LOC127807838 isoform X2 n=1 Tax=Diospyros lotus TaxID=55363 RepID=UPI0022597571|nr:uncharacterized protein LOC127807838 isoform X2 [Diospyros lotus]
MEMRRQCRLWWPNHLSSVEPASSLFLFGWFFSSSPSSLDVIVAFTCNEASLSLVQSSVQEILYETNRKMPVSLQEKCFFSLLGHCVGALNCNGHLLTSGVGEDNQINFTPGNVCIESSQCMSIEKNGQWNCRCCKLDAPLEHYGLVCTEKSSWIQLVGSRGYLGRRIKWIPKLHHIHWNRLTVSNFDLHVILYETPVLGSHHFSMGFWSSGKVETPPEKPNWLDKLYQKEQLLDLDTVVLAINSANSATLFFERNVGHEGSDTWFPAVFMFITVAWQLLAASIASLSTLFYIIFQFLHGFLSSGSQSWMYFTLKKLFCKTWRNAHLRSCQILYWPILLKDNGLRSQSCVEYAENAALLKHSMWSNMAIDVLLGYFLGIALFFHAESTCLWVSSFADGFTNYLLRTGCVWLMGVPAGFKLNTELAGVLGMISLNAIQIWSTLWFFVGRLFIYFVRGLALTAVLFGLTTPAALVIDTILLGTLHISTLHWLISHLYSQQIQAISALWRLFRGRKWNPLRQRYDSYDYSVEQHIVGSLLFMPLLLLLPTTSVFYIFFTIMKISINFICIAVEVIISIIHATPYMKILLWLVKPRRFPSGIWFEIISCRSNGGDPVNIGCSSDTCTVCETWRRTGQVVWPHYRNVFAVISGSFVASSAHRVLTGKSIPSTLGAGFPPTMPWISIPYKEYWRLCRDAILSCNAVKESNNT